MLVKRNGPVLELLLDQFLQNFARIEENLGLDFQKVDGRFAFLVQRVDEDVNHLHKKFFGTRQSCDFNQNTLLNRVFFQKTLFNAFDFGK